MPLLFFLRDDDYYEISTLYFFVSFESSCENFGEIPRCSSEYRNMLGNLASAQLEPAVTD
ncbi:hypothetical protein KFK09_012433 [Dendrobium nobile]|uniref:Uncharacterized protein n=1 Tax=Dendrobium nobile TaxID=94219 RepID=A0A8T3BIW9_DENNO|nr:hypothetical protein KFK09_012433 [Dendrobium nobile]